MKYDVYYEATARAPRICVGGEVVKTIGILFSTPEEAIEDARVRFCKLHERMGGDVPIIGFKLSEATYSTRDLWLPKPESKG